MASTSTLGGLSLQYTPLSGLLILEPRVFEDARGYFLESYNERYMAEVGIDERFVQDNHSYSVRNVVRGLHYQVRQPQGKLVRVVEGEILDVAVDLRVSSSTFGQWHAVTLSSQNRRISGFLKDSLTDSECYPVVHTWFIKQRPSTLPSVSARFSGTIRT